MSPRQPATKEPTETGVDPGPGTGVRVEEEVEERLSPLHRVVCHDDPVTTMDFVIEVLRTVFRLPHVRAVELMLRVHTTGAAVIGRYPEATAKRKVGRATGLARGRGFPLTFTVERDD